MKHKTQVTAPENTQYILVERTFELPVNLLFKAYEVPELIEQWMHTKVLKQESHRNGSYCFQTSDPQGTPLFKVFGVFHDFQPEQRIIRTFEMDNTPFSAQLEFLEFESLDAQRSRLRMHMVFRTPEERDQLMQMPFARGLHLAHNRLQESLNQLNNK